MSMSRIYLWTGNGPDGNPGADVHSFTSEHVGVTGPVSISASHTHRAISIPAGRTLAGVRDEPTPQFVVAGRVSAPKPARATPFMDWLVLPAPIASLERRVRFPTSPATLGR